MLRVGEAGPEKLAATALPVKHMPASGPTGYRATIDRKGQELANVSAMILLGHGPMSYLSPLSGGERKSNFGPVRSVDDPSVWTGRALQAEFE